MRIKSRIRSRKEVFDDLLDRYHHTAVALILETSASVAGDCGMLDKEIEMWKAEWEEAIE